MRSTDSGAARTCSRAVASTSRASAANAACAGASGNCCSAAPAMARPEARASSARSVRSLVRHGGQRAQRGGVGGARDVGEGRGLPLPPAPGPIARPRRSCRSSGCARPLPAHRSASAAARRRRCLPSPSKTVSKVNLRMGSVIGGPSGQISSVVAAGPGQHDLALWRRGRLATCTMAIWAESTSLQAGQGPCSPCPRA